MMRIEQLDLQFFGHFTNKQFSFGKNAPAESDFHIIYGVNEAGKTTFMESYLRLLYGFLPRKEPYDFRHGRSNLQVSALLQIDGETRKFQRKATSKNSLLDESDNVLPEAALQAHLGGLAIDDYRKLLCIDDDSIENGGEEIVNSRGDIGTLLFSAAAGISDLWQVLESVRTDADNIHKSRASKTRLALLKKDYSDIVKRIKQLDIPAGKLGEFTKALKKAEKAEEKARQEQSRLLVEVRKLERVLAALPMLERLDSSALAVASLNGYPDHVDVTVQQIIELQKEEYQANSERERLQNRQATLAQQLKLLPAEPAYAGLEAAMDSLSELHSRYRHAELEFANHQEALALVTTRMTTLVRERLHHEAAPETLVVDSAVIKSLKESLARKEEAVNLVNAEKSSIVRLEVSINNEELKLRELQQFQPPGEGLGQILEHFNAQALSGEYKAATQALREADQKVEQALDELSIKGQRFTQLPECSLMIEEAETQVERWQALNATLESARERQQTVQQELSSLTHEISQLESLGGLASDEAMQELMALRESAWIHHKASLTLDTAQAFESTLQDVDQAMDGRLSHASDLARLRDLHRQIPRVQAQFESLAESIKSAEGGLTNIEHSLTDVMQQAGIKTVMPPKAVLNWLRRYIETKSRVYEVQRLRKYNQPVIDRAEKLNKALCDYVVRDQATLEELLPAANTMLEVYQRHEQSRELSQSTLAELLHKKDNRVAQLEEYRALEARACADWEALVSSSFPVKLAADKLALSLEALGELREYNVEREALQKQCSQMQRDKALFIEKLDQLLHDNKLESGLTTDSNLRHLQELASQAKKQIDEKLQLEKKLEKALADSIDVENRLEAVNIQSSIYASLFNPTVPTADLSELLEAVQKAQQAKMLRKKYEEDLSSLRQTLGVSSEERARAMLAELDSQMVQERYIEKESELEQANDRSKDATEKRTRCEEQLSALTGDGEVAQLVEQRTTMELQMSELALDYLRLRLGHKLAEQAINRYRDKHRSAMMDATEKAFAQLTDGKYSALQTQSNGKEETLLAVDRNGTARRADQMSKGTRFQLYLALRAAAYDQLAAQGTCLPFICDDIFETFDEDRTRAACRVMEGIGQRGQAIYLTHHRHVVELAREVCGGRVRVHEL